MANTVQKEALGLSYVLADLVRQGAHVYAPIGGQAPTDCIALFEEKWMLRIEVKGYTPPLTNGLPCPSANQKEKHDVLAAVNLVTGEVTYKPPIVEAIETSRTSFLTNKEKRVLAAMREESANAQTA